MTTNIKRDWEEEFNKMCAHPEYTDIVTATRPEIISHISTLLNQLGKEMIGEIGEDENILDHHEKEHKDCPRCIEIVANNYLRTRLLTAQKKLLDKWNIKI